MAVYTALRSPSNFTSNIYFNMVGTEGETGPRYLSDGIRDVSVCVLV